MPEPLKDTLFSPAFFQELARDFQKHHLDFDETVFLGNIFDAQWENRELKERMRHTTLVIHEMLNLPYPEAVTLFKAVISEVQEPSFGKMCFPDYVEVFGLDHLEISLDALRFFTPYASSEFAIRPFILKYKQPVLDRMLKWAADPNEHVRRLASEGCRPRLPWAISLPFLKKNPSPILPILETLKADPSEFVRRSVSNNLNDISKDNPDMALSLAEKWLGKEKETDRLVKHAMRTLLKAGHTRALLLFGFEDPGHVQVRQLTLTPQSLSIGETLQFEFEIINQTDHDSLLRIEYAIDFVKKNGKMSRKIFQLTEKNFPPGSIKITRNQSFADLSTRKHYPGTHRLSIVVNGVVQTEEQFKLT